MDNKNLFKSFLRNFNTFYGIVILLIAVVTWFYLPYLAILEVAVLVVLIVAETLVSKRLTKKMTDYIEQISVSEDAIGKNNLVNLPYPMAVVRLDGTIVWYNGHLYDAVDKGELYNIKIDALIQEFNLEKVIKSDAGQTFCLAGQEKWFQVRGNALNYDQTQSSGEILAVLYFIDVTELHEICRKYENETLVAAEITVDNYEELMQNTDDNSRPQLIAALDHEINLWTGTTNGILKKTERDKYTFLFEKQYLEGYIKDKFKVLDAVRAINVGNKIPPTLSIGIGSFGETLLQKDMYARSAVDMALGRGGDQVVIRDAENFCYYGGKSKEIEKRTKVKARVVAFALRGLMLQAENILIMGHKNADMDCIGAALGVAAIARNLGKRANVILGRYDETVANLLQRVSQGGFYNGLFVSKQQSFDLLFPKTLVIVVDTHKQSLAESARILELAQNVVVIDHHRKSSDFILKAVLTYHESYASSTCEMVTEVISYMDDKFVINSIDIEAMYAGIVIDTKNFTFKTGVRTFEAAAYLKNRGVDPVSVKLFMQNDMDQMLSKSKIVSQAQPYRSSIMIASATDHAPNLDVVVAQAADELLEIKNIKASFVLYDNGESVKISGRSMGEVNVQVILEKLGGGGHMAVAGALLEGVSLDAAAQKLKAAIDGYLESE